MADDWRLVIVPEEGGGARLLDALREVRLEAELMDRLDRRLSVSADEGVVFVYSDHEETARAASRVVDNTLVALRTRADVALERWHPIEEAWEPASVPLPATEEEREAERQALAEREVAETRETGVPRWEVRVELGDHGAARELADRLEADGLTVDRHWRYLLVGAPSREDAEALEDRLRREAPAGATIAVEPSGGAIWEVLPANPFSIFGGMGV